jgi:hypothetical protein
MQLIGGEVSVDDQNMQRVNHFRWIWPGESLGAFRPELPKPTQWDQLLTKLGLTDSEALAAVTAEGDVSEQLRTFVSRFLGHYFVPEPVIKAVRKRRRAKRLIASLGVQPTVINSNTRETTAGSPM